MAVEAPALSYLNCKLGDPSVFRVVVETMKDLCKTLKLHCKETGMEIDCCDTSNVVLMSLRIGETYFAEYNCTTPFKIGINMETLGRVMRSAASEDQVGITSSNDPSNGKALGLHFTFLDNELPDQVASFEMGACEVADEDVDIPENLKQEYEIIYHLPSDELKKTVEALKDFGDQLEVRAAADQLRFSVSGDSGTGNISLNVRQGNTPQESMTVKTQLDKALYMNFSMRYFTFFVRGTSLCPVAKVALSDSRPFLLQYNLKDEEDGYLQFFLAPKLDER